MPAIQTDSTIHNQENQFEATNSFDSADQDDNPEEPFEMIIDGEIAATASA